MGISLRYHVLGVGLVGGPQQAGFRSGVALLLPVLHHHHPLVNAITTKMSLHGAAVGLVKRLLQ